MDDVVTTIVGKEINGIRQKSNLSIDLKTNAIHVALFCANLRIVEGEGK